MIRKKILELMREVDYLQKDKTNDFHKYKYVSDEAVMEKLHPLLVKHGILAVPAFEFQVSDPGMTNVALTLVLWDTEDEKELVPLTLQSVGSGKDQGDKGAAKAMTMAYKYAWLKLLALATGDDPEGDPETDRLAATPPVTRSGLTPVGTAAQNALSGAVDAPRSDDLPVCRGAKLLKSGTGKRGDWHLYGIDLGDKDLVTTFDAALADKASGLKGQRVRVVTQQGKTGKLELVQIDAATREPGDDDENSPF